MISSSPRHNVKNLLSASLCNPNWGHSSRRARLPPPPEGQRRNHGVLGARTRCGVRGMTPQVFKELPA